MSITYDGTGTTIAFGTTTAADSLKVIDLTLPSGFEYAVINASNLSNTAVKTKVRAALKEIKDFQVKFRYDATVYEGISWASNEQITLTFVDTGTLVIWGFVQAGDEPTIEMDPDQGAVVSVTITVSNLNGSSVETAPAYTPAST